MAEQNSYDFWIRYSNLCLKCKVCPLRSVIKHMKGTSVTFQVERIRSEHWQFLLSALSVDNSLTKVCFTSDLPPLDEQKELWKKRRRRKDEVLPIPYGYSTHNISDICKYTARLLTVSQALQVLIFENLPITEEDAMSLAEGLRVSKIKQFSLRGYPYSVEVIEIICRGLWDSEISLLELSDCNLSLSSLKLVCKLLKKHRARKAIEEFPNTLRQCNENASNYVGINSLNLNGNSISKKGIELLYNTLQDDQWMEAIYLQHCNIDFDSADMLFDLAAHHMHSLKILDLRSNDISEEYMKELELILKRNIGSGIIQPAPLWRPKNYTKLFSPKNKFKSKVPKKYSKLRTPKKERFSLEPAFRISYEIVDKIDTITTAEKAVQTSPTDDCSNHNCIYELREIIERLEYRLNQEISLRNSYMITLQKVKAEVRHYKQDRVIIDMDTYSEIKNTFEKFDKFFKMMKEFGLWDLVTTVGLAQYENNRLGPDPDGPRDEIIEDELLPQDEQLCNNPPKRLAAPKAQARCCSCHLPECISNQKLERENRPVSKPVRRLHQDQSQVKNSVDKSKVSKVFKDLRDQCTIGKLHMQQQQQASAQALAANHNLQVLSQAMANGCQGLCRAEIASSFQGVKNSQELFEKIKNALKVNDCFCDLIIQQPERFYVGPKFCFPKDTSGVKNVSSQTPTNDLPINYSCRKVQIPTLSENIPCSQKPQPSQNNSNCSSYQAKFPQKNARNQAVSLMSRDWEEQVKQNFPDSFGTNSSKSSSESYQVDLDDSNPDIDYYPTPIAISRESLVQKESVPTSNADQPICSSPDESTKVKSIQTSSQQKKNFVQAKMTDFMSNTQSIKTESSSSFVYSFNNCWSEISKHLEEEEREMRSNKSYLESVSNASTDKDVKSLSSEIEIYDPEFKDIPASPKNSISSTHSQHYLPTKSIDSSGPSVALSKKSSSKSSKKRRKQKKLAKPNSGGEVNASSSSVPSLSDITTVSSRFDDFVLNTASVMGQISGSEKGLS